MKSTQQILNKLQDEKIKCKHCGKYKELDEMECSATIDLCVDCALFIIKEQQAQEAYDQMMSNLQKVRG